MNASKNKCFTVKQSGQQANPQDILISNGITNMSNVSFSIAFLFHLSYPLVELLNLPPVWQFDPYFRLANSTLIIKNEIGYSPLEQNSELSTIRVIFQVFQCKKLNVIFESLVRGRTRQRECRLTLINAVIREVQFGIVCLTIKMYGNKD